MSRKNIPIWGRLRKAAGWPEVMVANLAGLYVERYEDIEAGRSIPTDPEREALRDVFFGPVKPQPVDSPLDAALLEAVTSVAKRQDLLLTSEQARDLVTVVAEVVKTRLERAFTEELAGAEPEGRHEGASR